MTTKADCFICLFLKLHLKLVVASNADKAAELYSLHCSHYVSQLMVSFGVCEHTI